MHALKMFASFATLGLMASLASAALADEGTLPTVRVPSAINTADPARAPWVWLDAADAANFEFNDAGQVTKWLGRGAEGVVPRNAVPSNRRWQENGVATREVRYGTRGFTNGVPAYCMGDLQSGIDLEFTRCEAIRTVFWVGDLARRAFLLGDVGKKEGSYHFHRQGTDNLTGNDNTDYGLFHNSYAFFKSANSEVRVDGVTAPHNVPVKPGARHVIVVDVKDGEPATASLLSDDRPPSGGSDRTGGRALSELVIFTNRLSAAEVAKVENYLLAKWQGTTVDVSSAVAVDVGMSYPHVTVGDGAVLVYSAAALVSGEPAVEVMGALAKREDAKLVVRCGASDALTAFRGVRPLLACAESSLTADDFELQGFPEGTELDWTGTTLSVRVPATANELIPAALTAMDDATAPWVWYDAADPANFLFNEAGGVTNWLDRGARKQNAVPSNRRWIGTDGVATREMRYGTRGVTNGVPAYCMGELQSGIDLAFARCDQIRTVFWVGDLARFSFLLGDKSKYHFHRQGGVISTGDDTKDYGLFHSGYSRFQPATSEVRIDGVKALATNVPVKPGARHVILADTLDGEPATACYLADDRPPDNRDRTGGRALSELVVFTNRLSALDIAHVESYLRAKWMNATERIDAAVDVTDGAAYPNLALGTGASITVNCDALSTPSMRETPRMTVYGMLRKDTVEKIVIRCTGQPRNAVLLRCSAVAGLDASDFRIEGADKWKVAWEGTTLSLVPPKGLVVVVH